MEAATIETEMEKVAAASSYLNSVSYLLTQSPFSSVNYSMQISIINGPNLNLLGTREPEVYGGQTFESYLETLREQYPDIQVEYFQSNVEGLIIDELQRVGFSADGIILNAGGYTHTAVAIRDAIAAISSPVIEVHISNVHAREEFRKSSLISEKVVGSIAGLGLDGYRLAMEYLLHRKV